MNTFWLIGVAVFISLSIIIDPIKAAPPLIYTGQLLDADRQPIQSPQNFRFSLWTSSNFVSLDTDENGLIDTGRPNYAAWQETHVVSPGQFGSFSVELGKSTPLPNFDMSTPLFLQIEVKPVAAINTEYQLLDPTKDNGNDSIDRNALGISPYASAAINAEQTFRETFVLDADATIENAGAGEIQLQFGNSLGVYLAYRPATSMFVFNDDVNIDGDLTVTGLINGIDFGTAFTTNHPQNTDSGTTQTTFEINSSGNSVIISSNGLTADRTVTFDDADTTVVGTDNTQTLTNKTIDGDNNSIQNLDYSAFKDRNKTILLSPEVENISIHEDGSDNAITLTMGYDEADNERYYTATSQSGSLQDIDLYIPFQIPDDFVGWQAAPIQVNIRTDSFDAAQNSVNISMEDSLKSEVALAGANDLLSTITGNSWRNYDITFAGTPTFIPGSGALIRVKLKSQNNNGATIGHIRLYYVGK